MENGGSDQPPLLCRLAIENRQDLVSGDPNSTLQEWRNSLIHCCVECIPFPGSDAQHRGPYPSQQNSSGWHSQSLGSKMLDAPA